MAKAPKGLSTDIICSVFGTALVPTSTIRLLIMKKTAIRVATCLVLACIGTAVSIQIQNQRLTADSERVQAEAARNAAVAKVSGENSGPVRAGRVAVVDQKQAFANAPKTKIIDAELRTYGRSLEEEDQRLRNDATISFEERSRRQQEFRVKAVKEMNEKKRQFRDQILSDISKATERVALEKGYSLILDKASLVEGTRTVLFKSDESEQKGGSSKLDESLRTEYLSLPDLTDDILDILSNGQHPAAVGK
jgi:Skp family chaperone for outer membrane proteins